MDEILRLACLSVCLSICLSARISENFMPKFQEIVFTFYVIVLGPFLTTVQYVAYFLFRLR